MTEVTSIVAMRFNGHNQGDVEEFAKANGGYVLTTGGMVELVSSGEKSGIGSWVVICGGNCVLWTAKKMKTYIEECGRILKIELD